MGVFRFVPSTILIIYLTSGSATPISPPAPDTGITPQGSWPKQHFGELTVIGDSYAAGGGANGWIQPLTGCMQSDSAYAHWLGHEKDLGIDQVHLQACAGSGAAEIQVCQLGVSPADIDLPGKPKPDCAKLHMNPKAAGKPGLVVSQFGIDKIAFDQVIRACLYRRMEFDCAGALKVTGQHLDDLDKSTDIKVTNPTGVSFLFATFLPCRRQYLI